MSEAKKVLEQAVECWNARDRGGWAALYTKDVVYEAPGGARISGLADLKEKYFDALVTAAPDRPSRKRQDQLYPDLLRPDRSLHAARTDAGSSEDLTPPSA